MLKFIVSLAFALFSFSLSAQNEVLSDEDNQLLQELMTDSIHGAIGAVQLDGANCAINVPDGFIFLNKEDSKHLLVDYWGNPEEKMEGILGIMVCKDAAVFNNVSTAYVVSYDDAGYVSDEDAESIDYADLLESMQDGIEEENKTLPIEEQWALVGWAWSPSYDKEKKVLAWAKHFRVGQDREIINYDVRVLGKAGFVIITAVASPEDVDQLQADNDLIVNSISFDKGFKYSDFDPETDHIAEWTIGGLIAGKVLAKAGFWGVIAKFSKLIILALIAFFAAMRKKIGRLLGFASDKE